MGMCSPRLNKSAHEPNVWLNMRMELRQTILCVDVLVFALARLRSRYLGTCRSALGHLIALDPSWMDSGASREKQSARPALGRGWHRSRQLVCRSALWSKHWPLGDGTHSKISVGAWPLLVHAQSAVPLQIGRAS